MHWKSTKPPVQKVVMPITEAMKGKSVRDVQAKMKRPIGRPVEAKIAGTRRCSWARGPLRRRSGFCSDIRTGQLSSADAMLTR